MPQFAANLTMLFTEVPFLDRFERAARAGFEAVEFLFPYAVPGRRAQGRASRPTASQLVLHNLPAGDWDAGERGIACLPGPRRTSSAKACARRSTTRRRSACPQVNCLAGKAAGRRRRTRAARKTFVDNLRLAAERAEARGHPGC